MYKLRMVTFNHMERPIATAPPRFSNPDSKTSAQLTGTWKQRVTVELENQALHLIVPNKWLKSCIAKEGRDKPHCELSCFLRDLRILAYKFEHISHIYPQDGDGNRDDDERENGGVRLSSEFFVLLCAESLSAYGFQSAGHT